MRLLSALLLLLLSPAALPQGLEIQPAPATSLVLDGTGYFRQYTEFGLIRLSAQVLHEEGDRTDAEMHRVVFRSVNTAQAVRPGAVTLVSGPYGPGWRCGKTTSAPVLLVG